MTNGSTLKTNLITLPLLMRNKYKLKGNTTNCLLLSYEGTKMCLSNKYYGYNIIAKE